MSPTPTPRRVVGLAVGSIWLVAISAIFAVWALIDISTPVAALTLYATVVALVVVMAFGVLIIRLAGSMRVDRPPTDQGLGESSAGSGGPGLLRRFAFIVGLEVAAFAIANTWAAATGRFSLIPSLDLIIVGLHFFPLAVLFNVPRYHLMAIGFCAIPVMTLIAFPPEFLIGQAGSWYVVPSLGCGLVAGATAIASLKEAWRGVQFARDSVSES